MAGTLPSSGQAGWPGGATLPSTSRGVDPYQHQRQPFGYHYHQPAELDGADRPIPELPSSPTQSRPPVVYRPYRPPQASPQHAWGAGQGK